MALQKIDVGENVINREEENKQEKNYQEILEKQEKNDLDISFQVHKQGIYREQILERSSPESR